VIKVLFVCLGNICRSPAAEGFFRREAKRRRLEDRVAIDSAAIGAWHVGEPPDRRAQSACLRRGVDIASQRARRIAPSDADAFDYIVAMDSAILEALASELPAGRAETKLLLDYATPPGRDVPDPYYGTADDFELMLDLVEEGVEALVSEIERRL